MRKMTIMTGFSGARMSDEDTRRYTRLYDPKVSQQITEEGQRQLREYITRDLEVTDDLRANLNIPAPAPRPTVLQVAVQIALSYWGNR